MEEEEERGGFFAWLVYYVDSSPTLLDGQRLISCSFCRMESAGLVLWCCGSGAFDRAVRGISFPSTESSGDCLLVCLLLNCWGKTLGLRSDGLEVWWWYSGRGEGRSRSDTEGKIKWFGQASKLCVGAATRGSSVPRSCKAIDRHSRVLCINRVVLGEELVLLELNLVLVLLD